MTADILQAISLSASASVISSKGATLPKPAVIIRVSISSADFKNPKSPFDKFTSVVVEGNTRYYFQLEDDSLIYIAPISLSDELPLTQAGDEVTIEYFSSGQDQSVLINSFVRE